MYIPYTGGLATGLIVRLLQRVPSALMTEQTLEIKLLETADEMAPIVTMFQQVWGTVIPVVGVEMLRRSATAAGTWRVRSTRAAWSAPRSDSCAHEGDDALHSHVTGILPGVTGSGVGRAMKNHQRAWAAEQRLKWVTWTYDPLVRRNVWFNIEVLRAHVADYLVDFYGPMTDSINARDESDRLLVAWPTDPSATTVMSIPDARQIEVPTPEDVVVSAAPIQPPPTTGALRFATSWERMHGGAIITGFTRAGVYIMQEAQPPSSTDEAVRGSARSSSVASDCRSSCRSARASAPRPTATSC